MNKFLRILYDKPKEGGDPPKDPPEGDPPKDPPKDPPEGDPPKDPPKKTTDELIADMAESQSQTNDTVNKLVTSVESLVKAGAKPPEGVDKEFTLEELRDLEMKVHAGEMEQRWLPIINEKRAKLIANSTADETTKKIEVLNQWDVSHGNAHAKYEELKDGNSEHFKLAQNILFGDPGYKKYLQLKEKGITDLTLIDPNLPEKAADQAYGQMARKGKDKPKSKPDPKTELGGRSIPKVEETRLGELRDKAVETGERGDWRHYFREREKSKRAAGAAV